MSKTAKWFLAGAACAVLLGVVSLFVIARSLAGKVEPEIRARVIHYLEQRFDSRVTLQSLRISLPRIPPFKLLFHGVRGVIAHVECQGLSLRFQGRDDVPPLFRDDVPPLFQVDSLAFDLDLGMLRQAQPEVPHVSLDGMKIAIPPKSESQSDSQAQSSSATGNVVIDSLDISHASILILPKRADAKPLDFAIDSIHLASAGIHQQMAYDAKLTNPKPPGQIVSQGKFGPWNAKTPGDTQLEGDYVFSNADLSVFKGIAGILHSVGHFKGSLSAVRANGEATVPDFRLESSGNRVPLQAHFDAIIDGLNGNTILQPVQARLRNTSFETSGGVVKRELNGRRAINLTVHMPSGHIEDLLLLAVKGKPFMSGIIRMNSKIAIPPLSGSVKDKLFLDGTFDIRQGEFLRDPVQDKIDELSRRGQGRPGDRQVDNVFSHMDGAFRLEDQVMTFSHLNFAVPGAEVGMHGNYRMDNDVLDFHGDLKLQAKVSETVQGWKHWLAKPIDRFFEKEGAGTFLRIQVVGSARNPAFGLDHGEQKSQ